MSPEVNAARARFKPFLESNHNADLEIVDSDTATSRVKIVRPWGEENLVILLPIGDRLDELAEALNNVLLPERYTALWHRDTKKLEVIWTAYPLSQTIKGIVDRKFSFSFDSIDHECNFGPSSERLLCIAEHSQPTGMSHTNHRNLLSYSLYVRKQRNDDHETRSAFQSIRIGEPVSFWISNIDWDDDKILHLIRHLNFYLTYFDRQSPHIFVHTSADQPPRKRTRYLFDHFPMQIDARKIEDDLLLLWMYTREGDAATRFVSSYRIIEYAAHAYIDKEAHRMVRRHLSAPHARSDIARLADNVISAALTKSEQGDIQRINKLLEDVVPTEMLWRAIDLNRIAFSSETQFDGGFVLRALISDSATHDTWAPTGLHSFAGHARNIRNHLSHGRDRGTQTSIMPTLANFRRLEPWTEALQLVAGEIMNFKDL